MPYYTIPNQTKIINKMSNNEHLSWPICKVQTILMKGLLLEKYLEKMKLYNVNDTVGDNTFEIFVQHNKKCGVTINVNKKRATWGGYDLFVR